MNARFYELNHHLPKLQLLEVFPLVPFLMEREGMVTFDVGANMGLWSEAFLKTFGPHVRQHHMFEPLLGNQVRLEKRDANVLSRLVKNTKIHKVAVGPEDGGVVDLHFDTEHSTLASISNTQSVVGQMTIPLDKTRRVPQISVDEEMARQDLTLVDFMKIDVEGYEMPVLRGASAALAAGRIRTILFEFGAHQASRGESFRDFHTLLSGHGYQVYKVQRGRNFFGFAPVEIYHSSMEPEERAVEMVLASLDPPSPLYKGPRVIGGPLRRGPKASA